MKKLIMTTVAALGFAVCAKADVLHSTGFEGYGTNPFRVGTSDSGDPNTGTQYWTGTGDFSQTVLKTYAEAEIAAPTNVPDAFKDAASNTTFLSVDTGNDVMFRKAVKDAGSVDLTQGAVFFDANVKFTASEMDVVPSEGDKLLVWLKGDENSQTTNLVVTAGILDDRGVVTTNETFVTDADVEADTWYRLTVKAGVDDKNCTYFNVYIDGKQVSATYKDGVFDSFPSLVESGSDSGKLIEAAGFQGTGALDNVVWTTTDPFPPAVVDEFTASVTLEQVSLSGEETDMVDAWALEGEVKTGTYAATATVAVGDNAKFVVRMVSSWDVTVTATIDGVQVDQANIVKTDGEGDEEGASVYTITIDGSKYGANETAALVITITENGSGDEPVPAKPGEPAVVEAETDEQAVAKVNITVPAAVAEAVGEDTATYVARFTKVARSNGDGKWTVSVVLTEAAVTELKADADAGVADLLDVVTGDAESATATVPAGFYWALSEGTSLEGMANGAGQISDGKGVSLNVDKSGDAGFYQLIISPEPIPATAE